MLKMLKKQIPTLFFFKFYINNLNSVAMEMFTSELCSVELYRVGNTSYH